MKKEIPSNNRPENGAWRDALARLRAEGRVRGDGTVLSPNGEDSVLYRTLLDETGNRDEALKLYAMVHTPAFKAWFGNWERKIVEDSVFDKPPTTIRVPEAWKSLGIKELRDRIEAELIDMANGPDPLVHPVLGDVSISKGTGVKKIINASRDPAKLFVAGDLRNAFGASRLFEEEPAATAGKNIKSFERTLAKVSIGGTSLVAIFTVRRLTDGRQFYNTVTLNEVTPAVSLRDTPASRERATSAFAEVSAYIRQDYARVNPDSVSKVVDANGEPLVVWHGTGRYGKADEFDTFRSQATVPVYRVDGAEVKRLDSDGASISQYDDATLSDGYHYGALTDALTMGPEAALAFRLDESRAFPSRDGKESRHVADIRRLQGKIVTQDSETKPTGDGFYFSANQGYGIVARSQVKIPAFLNLKDPADLSEAAIEFAGSSWKSRQLASQGYDGAAYHHYDSRRFEQVVVFKPTQVKHATRNNGDFSNAAPSFLRMGAAPSIAQASLPAERLGKFVEAASALIGEGIRTPQALAEGLDRLAPGGQLRQYSQAFWDAFGMVDNTLRGTHDWDAVYNPPASAAAEAAFIEMSPENEIDALVLERMVPPEFPEGFTAQSVRRLLSGDPAASIRANGSIRRLLDAGKINTRRDGSFEVVTSRVTDQEDAPVEDGVVNTIAGRMSLTEFEAKGYAPEQVTVEDWINLQRAERRRLGQPEGGDNARDPWVEYREFHADAVERAVQAGETVDPEVLEFYPNLAADQLLRTPAEADSATAEADSVPLGFGAQSLRLAELLAGRIRRKEKTSIQQLSSLAAEIFGGSTGTGFDIKTAYDAVEMAINTLVLDSRILIDASPWEAARNLEGIREWLEYIPTQTRRTGEMDALQQFSTPPHFAYIAAWVAGVNSRDVGLEPSAGLGGLASFMHRAGAQVVLNELSDRRRKMLDTLDIGRPATGHDAGLLHAILLPSINSGAIPQPTVVVMNPPFSNSAAGRKDLLTGGYHIDEALKLLAPSGRLVAIVGEGMSMDAPRYRDWWRKVESKYAVRANIHVDGREYTKYGTSFSNRILVIDKIAPTGEPIVQGEVRTIEELIPLLNPVRIARPEINERGIPDNPPPSDQPSSLDEDAERVNDTADLSGSADSSLGTARPGAGGRGGRSRRTGSRGGRRGADGGSNASSGVSTDAAASNDGRSEDAGRQDTGGTQGTVGSDLTSEVGEAEKAEVDANEIFSDYRPRKVRIKGAQPHPSSLVESSSMASVELPDNPILPNIPAEVVSEGAISSAQLEAVAYAALAHETVFEDGRRQGFFIGDGTGVGKGREIAGVIFHNWREGRKKAIWISEKKGLYEDAGRDFRGIGAGDIPLIDMASKIATPEGDGVAFLTYDSLKGNFSGLNPLRPRPFGGKGAEGVKKEIPSNKKEIPSNLNYPIPYSAP